MTRSSLARRALTGLALSLPLLFAGGAHAQSADSRLTILVGFPPGGNVDSVARALSTGMQQVLGRTVVVENKPGAGGQIAMQTLVRAPRDGRTLMLSNEHAVAIIPQTFKSPGYDVKRDIAPVATVVSLPLGFAVHPSVPARNLQEFAAWAKSRNQNLNVGVPAPASQPDFSIGLIGKKFGVQMAAVPYKGGAPMVADLLGGHLSAGMTGLSELLAQHRSGKIRIIAVSGSKRMAELPEVPTFADAGIAELAERTFMGLFAPAGTPADVLGKYRDAVRQVTASAEFQRALTELGLESSYGDAADLTHRVDGTTQTWGAIIRAAGYVPQ